MVVYFSIFLHHKGHLSYIYSVLYFPGANPGFCKRGNERDFADVAHSEPCRRGKFGPQNLGSGGPGSPPPRSAPIFKYLCFNIRHAVQVTYLYWLWKESETYFGEIPSVDETRRDDMDKSHVSRNVRRESSRGNTAPPDVMSTNVHRAAGPV